MKERMQIYLTFVFILIIGTVGIQAQQKGKNTKAPVKNEIKKDKPVSSPAKTDSIRVKIVNELTASDTLKVEEQFKLKVFKKNAHASYYASRFEGKRTANGEKFSNTKYTAAHKKLPFGTKVKVTNESNGKSVMVTINDRGPFAKSRDIDLSKKAFLDISNHKNEGVLMVTIEVVEE